MAIFPDEAESVSVYIVAPIIDILRIFQKLLRDRLSDLLIAESQKLSIPLVPDADALLAFADCNRLHGIRHHRGNCRFFRLRRRTHCRLIGTGR